MPVYDFHCHSTLSDGALSPPEVMQRAMARGYRAMAITDHSGLGFLERFARELAEDCANARRYWGLTVLPGVELTHMPPEAIDQAAERAKALGALVIVHGESPVEPVPSGTNRAALQSRWVDILAHPGLITEEEALLAARRGIFLEISARRGHSLTNGHLVGLARRTGAPLLVNSDAHAPEDLLSAEQALLVARGSGLSEEEALLVLEQNPLRLLERLNVSLP
ncbi:MAG TPA: histidinol phosphate phosphatase domain-containing protein [Dehalococcoidia bacterium]|nr:histidinol phosphate phosphatase domain-containing protein [Dehalococcoidia bacterium]